MGLGKQEEIDSTFTERLCRGISGRISRSLFLDEVIVKLSYRVKKESLNATHDRKEIDNDNESSADVCGGHRVCA